MNIILLEANDFPLGSGDHFTTTIKDRRFKHISQVQKPKPGDVLRIGMLDGKMGIGKVLEQDTTSISLAIELTEAPPAPLPLTLLLALPRPKMLRRILQTTAAMGVKHIVLLNTYRVEKSYWQTPWLTPEAIREQLILGLEQARDTLLPKVELKTRFKPFVEDELPALAQGKRCWVAHPDPTATRATPQTESTVLAIGPEGGFIPYEIDKLQLAGFQTLSLGPRILRVENAVPVLLAKLFD